MRFAPGLACTFNGSLDISGAGLVDGYLGLLFRCWMVGCLVLFWLAIWLAGQFAKWSKSKHQQQDTIASSISVIIMMSISIFMSDYYDHNVMSTFTDWGRGGWTKANSTKHHNVIS